LPEGRTPRSGAKRSICIPGESKALPNTRRPERPLFLQIASDEYVREEVRAQLEILRNTRVASLISGARTGMQGGTHVAHSHEKEARARHDERSFVMSPTTTIETVRETVAERLSPAFEESVRDARRAITQGQYAVEDFAAGAALQVRRHPLASVLLAGVAGGLAGWMCGFVFGWRTFRRTHTTRD
jgi:hypothetical protein